MLDDIMVMHLVLYITNVLLHTWRVVHVQFSKVRGRYGRFFVIEQVLVKVNKEGGMVRRMES